MLKTINTKDRSRLLSQIAGLGDHTDKELRQMWRDYYGREAPNYKRGTLIKGIAYRLQELVYGGMGKAAKERLEQLMDAVDGKRTAGKNFFDKRNKHHRLIVGTKLVREWNDQVIEVNVVDNGFEHAGMLFKSLSALTKHITGTQWNGWAFFGLNGGKNNV